MTAKKKKATKPATLRDLPGKADPKGGMTPRHTIAIGYDAAGGSLPGVTVTAS